MTELSRRTAIFGMAGCLSLALGHVAPAWAGDEAADPGSGTACVISGDAYVDKDTTIYSEVSGGNEIGKFSGAKAPLKATRFPKDASQGRVLINGGDGFRLEGFTNPRALTVFGSRDLPVVAGHLWISASTPMKFAGAAPGKVRVEHPAEEGYRVRFARGRPATRSPSLGARRRCTRFPSLRGGTWPSRERSICMASRTAL